MVQAGRYDSDAPLLDECIREQFSEGVIGEDDHALGGRKTVAAGAAVVLRGVGVAEIAGVAIGDHVELAEHEPLAERQGEGNVAGREGRPRAVKDGLLGVAGSRSPAARISVPGRPRSSSRVSWSIRSAARAGVASGPRSARVRGSARGCEPVCR